MYVFAQSAHRYSYVRSFQSLSCSQQVLAYRSFARKLALSDQPKGFACLFRVCLPSLIWSVQRPSLAQNSFTQCLGYCLLYPRSISFIHPNIFHVGSCKEMCSISLPSLERIKLRIQPKGFTQTLDHDCYMIGSLNVLDIVCYIQEAYRSAQHFVLGIRS